MSKREQRKREQSRRVHMTKAAHATPRDAKVAEARRAQDMAQSVCQEVQNTAGEAIGAGDLDAAHLAEIARTVALRVIGQAPLASQHACRAGCAYCCHTAVTVNVPEAIGVLARLRATCPVEQLAEVRDRIEANARLAGSMTRQAYVSRNIRCALLTNDGNCRVHAVRPLACAGHLSTSQAACEAEFRRVPGRAEVPIDRYSMAAGLGAAYGLRNACAARGADGDSYELHHALLRLWDVSDASPRWTAGERLMEGCLRADRW